LGILRLLDAPAIAVATVAARTGARGRANHNVHRALTDPVQRFLNVFQPSSYVRPHRHEEFRWELFLLLEGEAAALVFDDEGNVIEHARLARGGTRGIEIPGGVWHSLLALAPDTQLFEVKLGPYRPLDDKDFASWAPLESAKESRGLLADWRRLVAPERAG
jgi:cupin fold WbuC family metalloprotein